MKTMKRLYIFTMGCQMNVYDSELIAGILQTTGYRRVHSMAGADLVIANTCAIRRKSEQKAFSFLGRTAELKQKNPNLIVGIGGCVAQQEGDRILKRFPFVDLVFGTDAIGQLPNMVRHIEETGSRMTDVSMRGRPLNIDSAAMIEADKSPSKFVTIMRGCDNFCTYCVVPYVRGRERSRSPEDIIREIRRLADSGTREITLLGQNVNSYGLKEGLCSFPVLIKRISDIQGIERIRFTTSHPKDLSDELIESFQNVEKLCGHIHLPVQSGSNAVLKRMNRKYTIEAYLEKMARLREARPGIAVSSDIIVGFPGEQEADFLKTLDLIKTVEYDSLFMFQYSDRPNAPASAFSGKIPTAEKKSRLQALLAVQESITRKKNAQLVKKTVEVLVEGWSKLNRFDAAGPGRLEWSGRTSTNKIVNFTGGKPGSGPDGNFAGKSVHVYIEKALAHSLWGRLIEAQPKHRVLKGERLCCAK
ncbi:MAG: tRNA (N6-isopentenyl adenosine(37)-C2)-methylthiotransferase MiaB [Desulfobacterales bacterium]